MRTISRSELLDDFDEILAAVKSGQTFAITDHGDVMAIMIAPHADAEPLGIRETRP